MRHILKMEHIIIIMYALLFTLAVLSIATADRHAIIIAPRDNWYDYGVQSESCRMYKDLIAGGMKAENIVLMSTRSVSDSKENPFPGELFTDDSPDAPGKDYANGCVEYIDYESEDMSGKVMLAIMRGDVEALKEITGKENPKALSSTAEDDVMLYFTSHGGPGSILVGYTTVDEQELISTIKYMYDHKMYKRFLFLLEACYSGSMFVNLPADWNVYALTAADPEHSSYESHCPPNDVVDGKALGTCLSCYWDNAMEWFLEGGTEHTLNELHKHIHDKVSESSSQNASQYGAIEEMGDLPLSTFMGDVPAGRLNARKVDNSEKIEKSEVPAHLAKWKAIRASAAEKKSALEAYEKILVAEAKKEVEVMRLGRMLMNEKAADNALKTPAESYSASCVRDLSIELVKKCGHTMPFPQSVNNMLRNICLPGLSVPNVNWNDICM